MDHCKRLWSRLAAHRQWTAELLSIAGDGVELRLLCDGKLLYSQRFEQRRDAVCRGEELRDSIKREWQFVTDF